MLAGALVLGTGGAAMAISDGNYGADKQHCPGNANNSDHPDSAPEGCRAANVAVYTGDEYNRSNEVASAGVGQEPAGVDGDPRSIPHEPEGNGPGTGAAAHAADGLHVYFGADDNLDFGEHDSSDQVNNGPSDGGAIQLDVSPALLEAWLDALTAGNAATLLTSPVPLVSFGTGACADGVCFAAATSRRTAFAGGSEGERNVANYDGKQWDPETCSGPKDQQADCGGRKLAEWNKDERTTHVEPGVTVFEDPDAQGSPAGPIYPIPGAYAGTCGVVLGGGSWSDGESYKDLRENAPYPFAVPEGRRNTPITNSAGQVVVPTACGDHSAPADGGK